MIQTLSIQLVQQALTLAPFDVQTAQQKMAPAVRSRQRPEGLPGQPRVGGVLLLLYRHQQTLHVLLTRRREHLTAHAGQISFPGGRRDDQEPLHQTALRETMEEVGVPPQEITLLGTLTTIYIPPSDYEVHPFVGWVHRGERPSFRANPNEVAAIIEAPLPLLLDPATRHEEPWEFRGNMITIPFFNIDGQKVWGATAIMLSEFLERLRAVR